MDIIRFGIHKIHGHLIFNDRKIWYKPMAFMVLIGNENSKGLHCKMKVLEASFFQHEDFGFDPGNLFTLN